MISAIPILEEAQQILFSVVGLQWFRARRPVSSDTRPLRGKRLLRWDCYLCRDPWRGVDNTADLTAP